MTKRLTYACTALLTACGGRELEAQTDGATGSSSSGGGDSNDGSVSVSVSTTMMTSATTLTTDPTTMTDDTATTLDPDSTGTPGTTGGGSEGCCEAHATPGCDEEAVATCVCKASPECCVFEWAANCVDLAMGDCAATCMGPAESSGGSESSSGGVGGACSELLQLEYSATDAVLDGGWTLVDSQSKPGTMVASLDFQDPTGTVTWDVDVPCDDTWHIWVRAFDFGTQDTFYARLDGGPDPAPIFEADCTQDGQGYVWKQLNWRDPEMGMACEYIEDPWVAEWETGLHQFQLEARDSPAVARIVVTNDPDFVPM